MWANLEVGKKFAYIPTYLPKNDMMGASFIEQNV